MFYFNRTQNLGVRSRTITDFLDKNAVFTKKTSQSLFLDRFPDNFFVKIIEIHAGIDRQRLTVDTA